MVRKLTFVEHHRLAPNGTGSCEPRFGTAHEFTTNTSSSTLRCDRKSVNTATTSVESGDRGADDLITTEKTRSAQPQSSQR
jgi:hypothetical protein